MGRIRTTEIMGKTKVWLRTTEIMGRSKVWINGKNKNNWNNGKNKGLNKWEEERKKEKKYNVVKKTQIEKIWKMLRKDICWVTRLNNTMHYTVL